MRVALIHYSALPIIGGVEQIVAAHAALFRTHGHEAIVICRRGEGDVLLVGKDPYDELKAALATVDVVIVHNVLTMPFEMDLTLALWRLSAEEPRKRWIAWVHDLAPCNPDFRYDWHVSPWNRLAQACPSFEYVGISELRARQFETLVGHSVKVIPNGVAPAQVLGLTPAVARFATSHWLHQRDIVLIHPTRLLKRKNVGFGLEVLAELRRDRCDAVLLITALQDPHNAKSREYEQALRIRRRELGMENAALFVADDFVPAVDDLAAFYRLADALFLPSVQEGFGLPIVEAALHRLPIFCADVEPMNSLLEHSIHVFDPTGSPGDAAKLIKRTLAHSAPHRAMREALQRYSWDVVWQKHLAPLLAECGATP